VAALHSSSPLRILNLEKCGVDPMGAAALAEALRRGWAITDLQLGDNDQIDDDSALALAAALDQCASCCSLRTLALDDCGLTLVGALPLVRAFAAVPSLRSLSLRRNRGIQNADKPLLRTASRDRAFSDLLL